MAFKGNFRAKKGAAQVEAALVLPLVISAVLCTVWLMTVFYTQTSVRSSVHLALRSAAGTVTGTVVSPGETGYDGLYDTVLRAGEIGGLLEEEARRRMASSAGGTGTELKGSYNGATIPASMSLGFEKSYRGWGLYSGDIETDRACWYFNIDEAQWIRNDDWIRERKGAK